MTRFNPRFSCFGAAVLLLTILAVQVNGQRGPQRVPFCSLFDSAHDGKTFRSTSLMFHSSVGRVDGADTFLYSADCNGPDYFAIPESSTHVWRKWQRFFDKLPPEKHLVLEITFEGKPKVATSHLFGSLDGWTRAQITFSKIVSIRDVTKTPKGVLANSDAPKPEVERIEWVKTAMRSFLGSLYAPSNAEKYVLDFLSDDFRFTDLSGRTFTKDEYATLNAPWAAFSSSLKESRMSWKLERKTEETMIWRGSFELVFKEGPPKTYYCDVTFALQKDDWTIRLAMMITRK